jgi:N-acetylglucosamine malate deacetylase 1
VITAHPDDAETQMGGTLAKLADRGQQILLVDLTEGEPSDFAPRSERGRQAGEAARILGVERLTLKHQDRLLVHDQQLRLEAAALIREHQPRTVYAIGDACVHPHQVAATSIARAAVFLARLGRWEEVPGGERLAGALGSGPTLLSPLQDGGSLVGVRFRGRRHRRLRPQAPRPGCVHLDLRATRG